MAAGAPLTLHLLARSGPVLAGLLLLGVGLGNVVAGQSKIGQYRELLHMTAPLVQADPAALFPAASEGDERHELARAKLAFYQLLLMAGQLLVALGALLLGVGVLRLWMSGARAPADSTRAN